MQPWDKRVGESQKAYTAFLTYRDMGQTRSTAKVGRELGKTKTLMDRWSSRHSWVSRADQWDAQVTRWTDEEIRSRISQETAYHLTLYSGLMFAATRALTKLNEYLKDEELKITNIPMTFGVVTEAIKLGRLLYGEPTERTQTELADYVLVVGGTEAEYVAGLRRMVERSQA